MTLSTGRLASLVVLLSGMASACADEDLEGLKADDPRRVTVSGIGANAPAVTRVSLTPSTGQMRTDAVPVFYRVEVGPGDTVAVIAERFRLRPEYVIWNNEGALRDGDLIEGALLDIPSANGILHRPQPGDTLASIAARYGVEPQTILDHPANSSIAASSILSSTVILVPNGSMP